jgi:hypothetical protein
MVRLINNNNSITKEEKNKNVLATIATEVNEIRRWKAIYIYIKEKRPQRKKKDKQMAISTRKKKNFFFFFLRINKEEEEDEFKYLSIYVFYDMH